MCRGPAAGATPDIQLTMFSNILNIWMCYNVVMLAVIFYFWNNNKYNEDQDEWGEVIDGV